VKKKGGSKENANLKSILSYSRLLKIFFSSTTIVSDPLFMIRKAAFLKRPLFYMSERKSSVWLIILD